MTETVKQIIELIEPYMDKTLNEGCFIDDWKWVLKIHHFSDRWWYVCYDVDWDIAELVSLENYKIIWHYDITAVLRYILRNKNIKDDFYLCCNWVNYLFFDRDREHENIPTYIFSNKPLHIYTEEEEKDLLELFKKLWTEKK